MKKILPVLVILGIVILFFWQFIFKGLLPIPSDTIIGLYHPFRDLYAKNYPRGIPFKNFLITDPVRQQYPWRELAISLEKKLELPLWNPYNFSGTPLLANFQSASFYPLNILLFILPLNIGWGILIFLEPLLAGIFLFLYLNNLKLSKWASFLGAITFSFSGFFIAWMEWGTMLHAALWLPLILLSIDKIFSYPKDKKFSIFVWIAVLLFALISSFFAGHLQTFFYIGLLSVVYLFARWWQYGRNKRIILLFTKYFLLFTIITVVQWLPTFQFILLSARNIDQSPLTNADWFIPWQHLIQFIAPDFFGNPTTLNYWGVWNYGEFVGYVGILPLLLAIFALFFRHDKKTLFYGTVFFLSLIFSLPTIFAKLPYLLNIPFFSTTQPTRLLFLTDFSLVVLVALGFDYFLRGRKVKEIASIIGVLLLIFGGLWVFVGRGQVWFKELPTEDFLVAKRNLVLPTFIFIASSILLIISALLFNRKRINVKMIQIILTGGIIGLTIFDLLRFGLKFTPFTNKNYLFPKTEALSFLQSQKGQFRIMTTDSRILPPNFSIIYRLQSADGYDPLYLQRYAELIATLERGKPNISPPFGFNRIITPRNFDSKIIDLLGVKYVLTLEDLSSSKLKKVFQEGQTQVYENLNVLPRAFFVEQLMIADDKHEVIKILFDQNFDARKLAIIEETKGGESIPPLRWEIGKAEIIHYSENKIVINVENKGDGFLVLTDSFYPAWKAKVDGVQTKIYLTDYNFRGIAVPKGKHKVEFYSSLF